MNATPVQAATCHYSPDTPNIEMYGGRKVGARLSEAQCDVVADMQDSTGSAARSHGTDARVHMIAYLFRVQESDCDAAPSTSRMLYARALFVGQSEHAVLGGLSQAQAVQALEHVPYLSDLGAATHWHCTFEPSLGPLGDFVRHVDCGHLQFMELRADSWYSPALRPSSAVHFDRGDTGATHLGRVICWSSRRCWARGHGNRTQRGAESTHTRG